jgi:thiosulfate/3-mercaptopyruvate sulfurtransferase
MDLTNSGVTDRFITPLVEVDWLWSHLDAPDLRTVDATVLVKTFPLPLVISGKRRWKRCHIPGAAFADLKRLSDPNRPSYTFSLPDAQHFSTEMGKLGIGADSRVVLYDSRQNMWAARLWWMLRYFGFDSAAVLNGGLTAWQQGGYPTCTEPCAYAPAEPFVPSPRHALVVNKVEVLAAIKDPATCIVSALGRRQHSGARNEYRRRGHIPGARNVTAWEILDRDTQRYRPAKQLKERFGSILETERVITYCGAGIAAASDALALHLLGHTNVAIYDGGLVEWNADRKLPLELGE